MVCVHCQKNPPEADSKFCESCADNARDIYYALEQMVAPMHDPLGHPMCEQWVRDYYDEVFS